ncbi:hypothetical protein [Tsukamurella hominis]|uniref:hypothetical protein n=1 Tax=Tsukamurella hominis TaxID=1970232 RepID=UPI0039EB45EE
MSDEATDAVERPTYAAGIAAAYEAAKLAHSTSQRMKLAAQYLKVECIEVAPGVVALAAGATTAARELDLATTVFRGVAMQALSLAALTQHVPVGEVEPVIAPAIADADAVGNPVGLILADIVDLVDVEAGAIRLVESFDDVVAVLGDSLARIAHLEAIAAEVDRIIFGGSGVLASRMELLALSISGRLRVLEDMTVKLIEVAGAE